MVFETKYENNKIIININNFALWLCKALGSASTALPFVPYALWAGPGVGDKRKANRKVLMYPYPYWPWAHLANKGTKGRILYP